MRPVSELLAHVEGLRVTQGEGAGDQFRILPWERRFLRAVERVEGDIALTVARGNGKSTVCAAVADAALFGPLRAARGEVVVVASSFAQSRIVFEHCLGFLGGARSRCRIMDNAQVARIEFEGCRIRCIGSDPRRMHGLAPVLVLADEPAQWEPGKADRAVAALRTGLGKIPGSRLIALGTRPDDPEHWFARMLDGRGAAYVQSHAARVGDPPFQRRTWARANPSLDAMPALEAAIRREAEAARRDPSLLAAFLALRLNEGTADTLQRTLLDVSVWRGLEVDHVDRTGPYVLGVDLGGSAAMSAAAAYWPESGGLDVFAAFPALPSLAERGLADGVGARYRTMAERLELIVAGSRVVDVPQLLRECLSRWGAPAAVVCDRWREAELRQSLEAVQFPLAALRVRGMGFKDGGEDVREFRRAALGGKVSPVRSLLLRSAMSGARVASDPAGNEKLAKGVQGGRHGKLRDDAAAAAVLAVAEGARMAGTPGPSTWDYSVVV